MDIKDSDIEIDKKENIFLINAENDRILNSDLFRNSTVLCNFLQFIVKETLDGRGPDLKEYAIGVGALGKKDDFDPQTDAIVRIHAGRLRRQLKEYYDTIGRHDPIVIEMVKGSYKPHFHPNTNKQNNLPRTNENKFTDQRKLTLGILPFRDLSPDDSFLFFAEGFGEELTRMFSLLEEVDVIAHHSMRTYQHNSKDVRKIGVETGAHYLVTGTVRRTENEIRVTTGLLETSEGHQIWSNVYTHQSDPDHLFDIQDNITLDIFSKLGDYYGFIIRDHSLRLFRDNKVSLRSFDSAVWNYFYHMTFTEKTFEQTVKALESAIENDPTYATGLAMLSNLYLDGMTLGFPTVDDPLREASLLAKKAVNLNPDCQYAQIAMAWCAIHERNKPLALSAIEKSVAINAQNSSMMGTAGFGMVCAGEYDRGLHLLEKSVTLNPHCPWWFYLGFCLVFYQKGQMEQAGEYALKIDAPDVFLDLLLKILTCSEFENEEFTPESFRTQFPEIVKNLKGHLNYFLLDTALVDLMIKDYYQIISAADSLVKLRA